ncbi:hypothetical protein [Devosia lacusdianchii]|uniref:hypothetical protein n=1 Tax=Devosia lacusdianchii TaxID=2917991 RepID=UPI001F052678|nr:hypothetical protein [Devosia sp. JXJ CY 41]
MSDITHPNPSPLSRWVRQSHRWIAVAFTLSVAATFVALAQPEPLVWVSYLPLLPLALLFLTGVYMFALPYLSRWRSGARVR